MRQHEGFIRTFGLDVGPTTLVPPQPRGWSHLVSTRSGAMTLRAAGALTFVTPAAATWVPSGVPYGLQLHARCELRIAYVADDFCASRPLGPVLVSDLLREVLERAVRSGFLDPRAARDARLLAVAKDELTALEPAPDAHRLVLPRDAALLAAVDEALRAPDAGPAIALLASSAGVSVRTLERRFTGETGLSPRAWLRRARLGAAAVDLASGTSVTQAALASGYASLSAFIAAYRSSFGVTPGRVAQTATTSTRGVRNRSRLLE